MDTPLRDEGTGGGITMLSGGITCRSPLRVLVSP